MRCYPITILGKGLTECVHSAVVLVFPTVNSECGMLLQEVHPTQSLLDCSAGHMMGNCACGCANHQHPAEISVLVIYSDR